MSVTKMTLAREDNNGVEYYYPKTTADIVEYTDEQSVKDKLDSLDGVEREVREARTAYYDNSQKIDLKTRIDEDYSELDKKIENITNTALNDFAGILGISKGGTGKSTAYEALFNLAYRSASEGLDLDNLKSAEDIGVWYFGSTRHPDNAPSTATGYLIVLGETGTLRKQIWFNQGGSDNHHEIYTRAYTGSIWRDWVKIIDNKDLEDLKKSLEDDLLSIKEELSEDLKQELSDSITDLKNDLSRDIKEELSEDLKQELSRDIKNQISNNLKDIEINVDNLKDDFILPISKGGTDATIATQALYNLSTHIVSDANLDLNNFIGKNLNTNTATGDSYMGCYYFGSSFIPINAPEEKVTGYLIVLHGGGSIRKHIWINSGGDENYYNIYTRTYSSGAWKPWIKISTEEDITSLDQQLRTDFAKEISDIRKVALVGSDLVDQTGWHLVAEGNMSTTFCNASFIFAVHDTKSYNSGILVLDLRCNNGVIAYKNLGWLTRSGFSLSDFGIQTYSDNSWRLFYKVKQQYYRVVFEVIEVSGTATKDLDYTLYSNQKIYSNTGTPKGSVDLYIPYGRKSDTTTGSYSTAIGKDNTVSNDFATAVGNGNSITDNSEYSYTNGYNNKIEYGSNAYIFGNNNSILGIDNPNGNGNQSFAFGNNNMLTRSGNSTCIGRYNTIQDNNYSVAIGFNNVLTDNDGNNYKCVIGYDLSTKAYGSFACGMHNEAIDTGTNNSISDTDTMFTVGGGVVSEKYDSFRVLRNGDIYSNNCNCNGADYAEFIKEWYDGNPNNEDRVGYMVTIKNGKLHKANEGDYIIGITSGNPSIVGNSDKEYYWRYERDKFNRIIYEDIEVEIPKIDDEGNTVMEKINARKKKISSTYNSGLQSSYIERKDRPEWDYVGMRGIVPCRDDGTCEEGGFCKCGVNGIATKADTRGFDTYYVIERIDDETISVEVR